MSNITLRKRTESNLEVPFVVNLINEKTGETEKYAYRLKQIGNKEAIKNQMLYADMAKNPDRNQIIGSTTVKRILDNITRAEGTTLEFIDIFDLVYDDQLGDLLTALVNAATKSSVSLDNEEVKSGTVGQAEEVS